MNSDRERQLRSLDFSIAETSVKNDYQVPRNAPLKTNYKNQTNKQAKTFC